MKQKASFLFLLGFLCVLGFAQSPASPPETGALERGLRLYGNGNFAGAALELGKIGADNGDYPEALYWTGLAELSAGNYRNAREALNRLEAVSPGGKPDVPYHQGRILYYLGSYEDALVILSGYAAAETDKNRRAASLYWAGECLYALGQYDTAENVFAGIVENYPNSAKYEASLYRMDLIKQKKVEAELLSILNWTHEESLKTLEEYQLRERNYDQLITAYQKKIAELQGDTTSSDLALSNEDFRLKMSAAEQKISSLESSLADANTALLEQGGEPAVPAYTNRDTEIRVLSLQNTILSLRNAIVERLNAPGGGR
ncbi:MAG: tetratricopeptide repeat protein [Treponema sp.]|nr:tetratricopeptide repeat protein [Treponema sp.]